MEEGKQIMNIEGSIKSIEFIIELIKEPIKVGDPSIFHCI